MITRNGTPHAQVVGDPSELEFTAMLKDVFDWQVMSLGLSLTI